LSVKVTVPVVAEGVIVAVYVTELPSAYGPLAGVTVSTTLEGVEPVVPVPDTGMVTVFAPTVTVALPVKACASVGLNTSARVQLVPAGIATEVLQSGASELLRLDWVKPVGMLMLLGLTADAVRFAMSAVAGVLVPPSLKLPKAKLPSYVNLPLLLTMVVTTGPAVAAFTVTLLIRPLFSSET